MAVTPDTTISLLKVPIEIDNLNQLTFATVTDQYNYFNGCTKITQDDLYYQRKDNYIAFPEHIDNIIEYNYVMYQNSNYSQKWFYAFITHMEYENDGMTRVYIETDVFQTWQFDITFKASFVEREHVNDDTVGKHTIPENLSVGEVVCEATENIATDSSLFVAVATTWLLTSIRITAGTPQQPFGNIETIGEGSNKTVNASLGNILGTDLLLFPLTTQGLNNLKLFIFGCNSAGHIEDISNMYVLPVKTDTSHTVTEYHFHYYNNTVTPTIDTDLAYGRFDESFTPITLAKTLTISTDTFTSYTPKNNKVKVYPYNYLLVSNNIGSQNIYKIEEFSLPSAISFDYEFTSSVGGSARLIPKNYKGITRNLDESIALAKYPTCEWSADAYINWITQNAVNIPTKIISQSISSASKESTLGKVSSGAFAVADLIGDFYEASLLPKIEGGQSTGDINYAAGDNDFNVYRMHAKIEYLKSIDDYFSMYGYKVNELKVPNTTGRTYWNYVKTVNCNITGDIPQEDMQKIKDMFNNGVTLWHDSTKFLDYTQSNSIVVTP